MSDEHPRGWKPTEPVYDPDGRRNVLGQDTYWWDKWGWRHPIRRMEADYIVNVLRHLEWRAFSYAAPAALDGAGDGAIDDEQQRCYSASRPRPQSTTAARAIAPNTGSQRALFAPSNEAQAGRIITRRTTVARRAFTS